ncbi:MAG: acyltransferase, partial [Chitinophagaceae bacterium]|nr:acyltransferase [Chitinophagaceae bacterium]
MRGIAALMVVFYHFLNWDYKDKLYMKVASIVFNGADAVSFFFVLSGFVLSYKYVVLKHKLDVRKFYINRFFRLWPAFFIAVITNALYHQRHELDFHRFIELFIYNKYGFWQEAALIRPADHVYYLPGWTLTIELVMSFFIPFVVLMAHKDKRSVWWLAGFFFFVGT